jgi:hypothetical protein
MSLLSEAISSDSGISAAAKYLIDKVGPFFEMPLTGDTDRVREFQIERRIGELEALLYRIPPSPSATHRLRYLVDQLFGFAQEAGVPLGDDDSFRNWIDRHGTLEDKVMETVFEIDPIVESTFSMPGREVQELSAIRRNLLLNHTIYADLLDTMVSGGPGSEEELNAFEQAIATNLKKARRVIGTFGGY